MSRPDGQGPKILVGHADDPAGLPPGVLHVPDRPDDAPDRVDRTPRVSDDPAAIADVRARFDREVEELFGQALERARAGDHVFLEHDWALRRRQPRAIAALTELLADASAPAKGRARAAVVLAGLGDPGGERFLFDALASPSADLRAAGLAMLDEWGIHPDFGDPSRAGAVLDRIDDPDPDVALAACRLAASKALPGAEARMVGLLRDGRAKDPRLVARELIEVVDTPEGARVLIDALFRERPPRFDQGVGYRLERLTRHADPEIAGPVRDAFRAFTLGWPDRDDQSIVHDLAMVADAATVPVLDDIVARAKDPVSRMYAKEALARLDPDRAVDRLLDFLRPGQPYDMEVNTLRAFATESDADRIIAALIDRTGSAVVPLSVARLLLERLGAQGRAAIERSLARLEPQARMYATWKLRGLDLGTAIDDLRAAGVIAIDRDELIARMPPSDAPLGRRESLDPSDPGTLTEALAAAGLLTMFDAETGQLPCDHHRLILEFAEKTTGRFAPECPVQTWHRAGDDDFDGPYTVRFLDRGRLFTFGAENRGDWYDVEAVARALNFALEDAGRPERFLALESDGQVASFVFADPEAFRPFAAKYALPLSDDPDEAMRKGKAFERQVARDLGK